jgi:tripartite-type tricarboxylate transporter receptor subunit TctC
VDAAARVIAEKLPTRLKDRTIIIDNKPGAGGNIATENVARSAPDGTTLLITSNNHTINPALYRRTGYDAEKDFVAIAGVGETGFILVAHPSTGFNTLDDMVKAARANPNALFFGTGGNGHPAHLAAELLKSKAHIGMTHIPYKGSGPLITDVVGAQVPIAVVSVASAQPFIKNGQLKGLAVTSGRRWPSLPDVPTVAEAGYPGFDYSAWIGVFAPAGTPATVTAELERAVMAVVVEPDVSSKLFAQGMVATPKNSATFAAAVGQDLIINRQVIKSIGLQI